MQQRQQAQLNQRIDQQIAEAQVASAVGDHLQQNPGATTQIFQGREQQTIGAVLQDQKTLESISAQLEHLIEATSGIKVEGGLGNIENLRSIIKETANAVGRSKGIDLASASAKTIFSDPEGQRVFAQKIGKAVVDESQRSKGVRTTNTSVPRVETPKPVVNVNMTNAATQAASRTVPGPTPVGATGTRPATPPLSTPQPQAAQQRFQVPPPPLPPQAPKTIITPPPPAASPPVTQTPATQRPLVPPPVPPQAPPTPPEKPTLPTPPIKPFD
ncbi:MAG: hypothetical protein BWY68_00241 [bacterium ADurb.Bin400]|nr:MAG: hypothetical protein BWY68_00241 [bacterium ADurb.Bin400]